MHLLDTDTLTHLYAGHPLVIKRLEELSDPDVGTTVITKIELLRGRFDFVLKAATGAELLRAQSLLTRTEEQLAQILAIPLCKIFVEIGYPYENLDQYSSNPSRA